MQGDKDRAVGYTDWERDLIVALVLGGVVGAVVVVVASDRYGTTPPPSYMNSLLSFFLITIVGGGFALFLRSIEASRAERLRAADRERDEHAKQADRDRERREYERRAIEEFRRSLVALHHRCKKVRRLLRASSFDADGSARLCPRGRFDELMDGLEEIQLGAEELERELETQGDLFGRHTDRLKVLLGGIEDYLRRLLRQYEDRYAERRGLSVTDDVALGTELHEFIERSRRFAARKPGERQPSKTGYFELVREAERLLVELIRDRYAAPAAGLHR